MKHLFNMNWNRQDLERKKAEGKIRDYTRDSVERGTLQTGGRKVAKHWPKRSKEKDWIGWNLLMYCNENCLTLEEEFRFSARGFKSDWAIPAVKILIEYEGLFSEKSGHSSISGIHRDIEKYGLAQELGWRVVRLTAKTYKNLLTELKKLI